MTTNPEPARGPRLSRRRLWRSLGVLVVTGWLGTGCESDGDRSPSLLFGAKRTPTARPTPTLSAAQRDVLLGEGVARTRLGFFVRPPSGWNADLSAEDGVALRFANTTADSDSSGRAFASLLIGFEEDAVPAPEQRSSYLANTVRDAPERLNAEFQDFELVRAEVLDAGNALMAIVEFTYQAENGVRLRAIRALAPAAQRLFVIAATTLESAWPAYADAIRASLASFTLLGE